MDGGWLPVQGPAQDAAWRAVLRPLAGEFRKVVPELAVEMLEHVKAEMPHLFPDAQSEEEARASGVVNFLLFADSLEHGLDPRDFELPPVTAAVMRAVVHRRGSVAERMRLFRMAHALVWPWFFDHINAAAEDPAQRAAAVELATRWLFTYVDNAVTRAEAAYDVEREAWLQGNAAERTAAIEAILAGRETDPARAGRRLRFEVNRSHVGVVVWVETVRDDADAHPELMAAITCLGRAVDAQQVLPHPLGSLAVAAWLSGRRELPFEELRSAVDACSGELPAGVRVALGDPAPGLEGFRQTHLDAAHARRFASLVGQRRGTGHPLPQGRGGGAGLGRPGPRGVVRAPGTGTARRPRRDDVPGRDDAGGVPRREPQPQPGRRAAGRAPQHRELPGAAGRGDPRPLDRRRLRRAPDRAGPAAGAAPAGAVERTVARSQRADERSVVAGRDAGGGVSLA